MMYMSLMSFTEVEVCYGGHYYWGLQKNVLVRPSSVNTW